MEIDEMDFSHKKHQPKSAQIRKTDSRFQDADNPEITPLDMTQLQLLVLQKLQTSLDVEELLNMFKDSLHELTGVTQVTFNPAFTQHTTDNKISTSHIQQLKLFTREHYLGQLNIEFEEEPSEKALKINEEAAKLVAFPLQNALEYQQALLCSEQDTLTGIKNRNAMDSALEKACDASKRYNTDLSILMIDIDHFKKVNDTYGHLTGDKILQRLTAVLKQSCRLADEAFRFGGEEFLMLLQNTAQDGALEMAERIRKSIEINDFGGVLEEKDLPLTVSIGVAQRDLNDDIQQLIEKADQSLYFAKRHGRNQSIVYSEEIINDSPSS